MARPLRIEFEGAVYHVTVRGNGRREIFLDDRDRERFLRRLAESVETYATRLHAYCLMPNHLHLVLETPRGNLARFMQSLQTGYAVYFNLRHGRSGHLTQGRYGARLVEGDVALPALSRYVHLNPVRVKAVADLPRAEQIRHLRSYRWSSYQAYIGRKAPEAFVAYGTILDHAPPAKASRAARYRGFVEEAIDRDDSGFAEMWDASPRSIGGLQFRLWVDRLHEDLLRTRTKMEDISFHTPPTHLTPEAVLAAVCRELNLGQEDLKRRHRGSPARAIAARMLCRYSGITQRQAGAYLGFDTGAAVSLQLKRLSQRLSADQGLRRLLAKADNRLTTLAQRQG